MPTAVVQPEEFEAFTLSARQIDDGFLSVVTPVSPIGRAVHQSSLTEDIYLILSGFSQVDRNQATLKVLVRPLVIWMWIGGFVIAFGTLICISPIAKNVSPEP